MRFQYLSGSTRGTTGVAVALNIYCILFYCGGKMVRKTTSRTTAIRYKLKQAKLHGLPEETILDLKKQLVTAMEEERSAGFDPYSKLYKNIVKPILERYLAEGVVGKAQFGLYRSAAFEYFKKVMGGVMPKDVWVTKWESQGLDPGVLEDIATAIGEKI